ncbi:hypothetical protein B0I37DRAFT_40782 [Chaetomium sp. MPI-CAGE-AT-0009]|nr:hypothetical protein B0I37DRAFT_40782 [Chaetomium sp. MPI-CAGE-AT-0009]
MDGASSRLLTLAALAVVRCLKKTRLLGFIPSPLRKSTKVCAVHAPSRDPMLSCARWGYHIQPNSSCAVQAHANRLWISWSSQGPGQTKGAPQRQRPRPGCGFHGLALPGPQNPAELRPGPRGSLCRDVLSLSPALMWGGVSFDLPGLRGTNLSYRPLRSHGGTRNAGLMRCRSFKRQQKEKEEALSLAAW